MHGISSNRYNYKHEKFGTSKKTMSNDRENAALGVWLGHTPEVSGSHISSPTGRSCSCKYPREQGGAEQWMHVA